jgi:hypothetical protein
MLTAKEIRSAKAAKYFGGADSWGKNLREL